MIGQVVSTTRSAQSRRRPGSAPVQRPDVRRDQTVYLCAQRL